MQREYGIWSSSRKLISHSAVESWTVNLLASNPDFETGDTTGWTLTGASVSASSPISGSYSLIMKLNVDLATSNKHSCAKYKSLSVSFIAYRPAVSGGGYGGSYVTSVYLRFYDTSLNLLSTVTVKQWLNATIALDTFSTNADVPRNATLFDIYIVQAFDTEYIYLDNFTVLPTA